MQAQYAKERREIQAAKVSRDKIEECDRDFQWELRCIDDEIYSLITERLTRQAHRRLLPVAFRTERPENWEEGQFGKWYMTVKALSELRSAIRQENKERFDQWLRWLPGLTGILGTMIGLAALLIGGK